MLASALYISIVKIVQRSTWNKKVKTIVTTIKYTLSKTSPHRRQNGEELWKWMNMYTWLTGPFFIWSENQQDYYRNASLSQQKYQRLSNTSRVTNFVLQQRYSHVRRPIFTGASTVQRPTATALWSSAVQTYKEHWLQDLESCIVASYDLQQH